MVQYGSRDFLVTMAITFQFVSVSEYNLLKSSHFLNSFELLGNRKNLHISLRLLCLQVAAEHTTVVANANKCTETTSVSQRHCVT